ncbi:MAG: NBR1-Ig-like domain-containing protein [Anaerolineales bacterium]|nr:NBR1-Ig-like domain-containing protein [Anaerolineales bacterium]
MRKAVSKLTYIIPLVFVLALTACNRPVPTPTTAPEAAIRQTAAAVTLEAQLTEVASGVFPTQTPMPETAEPGQAATATQGQPAENPTDIPQPSATPASGSCDQAEFVADVNIPDGTQFQPGDTFNKTWRLKNTGDCSWDSNYSLVFIDGDSMGGPAAVTLTSELVSPGGEVEVTISLTAPFVPGVYRGNWKLRTPSGEIFGVGSDGSKEFWVEIEVVGDGTATPES